MTTYALVKQARDRLARVPGDTPTDIKIGIIRAEFPQLARQLDRMAANDIQTFWKAWKRICAAYRV